MLIIFLNPLECLLTDPVKKAESFQIYNVPVTRTGFYIFLTDIRFDRCPREQDERAIHLSSDISFHVEMVLHKEDCL